MPNTAVIYARVSSRDQETGGYSIPAQLDFLQDYAKSKGLNVVKVYTESITASESGRAEFNKMLEFATKQRYGCHVIIEKNDRLLRNEEDEALLIKLAVKQGVIDLHLPKDHLILKRDSTPYEIFMFHMLSGMSCMYPRNLSREVKKGMDKKAELGYYPAKAPVGYKNVRSNKKKSTIEVDPLTAGYVAKIFELYATGMYSYKTLAQRITLDGFYPKNKPCTKTLIEKILINPFYVGEFEYNGKRYPDANHTPIITKEMFYACKKIRERQSYPKKISHDFLYSGLMTCSHCGCQLTAEIKKGKYIYYHCTGNKGGTCKKHYLKEEHIDDMVKTLLEKIQPTESDARAVIDKFKEIVSSNFEYDKKAVEEVSKKISLLKNRLEKLYLDRLDGIISDDFYAKKKIEFQSELEELQIRHDHVVSETDKLVDMATQIIELCKNASRYYFSSDNENKRLLLKILCSNFTWDGENVVITLKSTVQPMLLGANFKNGGPKEATLELLAQRLYRTLREENNLLFFEELKLLQVA